MSGTSIRSDSERGQPGEQAERESEGHPRTRRAAAAPKGDATPTRAWQLPTEWQLDGWSLLTQYNPNGVFIALDLFVFYVFFEVMLIPMYFIIGIWGGANRLYAAIKFFIYTMAGSLLMLVAIVALVWRIHVDETGEGTETGSRYLARSVPRRLDPRRDPSPVDPDQRTRLDRRAESRTGGAWCRLAAGIGVDLELDGSAMAASGEHGTSGRAGDGAVQTLPSDSMTRMRASPIGCATCSVPAHRAAARHRERGWRWRR